jgi:hypothetical protein
MTAYRLWTMHKVKRPKLLLESEGSWLKPLAVSSVLGEELAVISSRSTKTQVSQAGGVPDIYLEALLDEI